jgi:(1->4)-alpha-D-glucan 1-alpha-D-glucosylmutase
VTAKGVEDTAFYVYNRLVSLNEVGGEPGRFGVSADRLHGYNKARQVRWPYSLSPLSTHDTKRSEDVRARIHVLSEIPDEWAAAIQRWADMNQPHRKVVEDVTALDRNEEYFLYQTLIGAWPLEIGTPEDFAVFVKRIQEYMLKALHEAKVHTSWINPNSDYDNAISQFVADVLDAGRNQGFIADFQKFQTRISHYGLFNSLSQTLLKLTSPGVPDTYQGSELWDFSLVDPDNRRPVDYDRRKQMLGDLSSRASEKGSQSLARELLENRVDGRIKLYITQRVLDYRCQHRGLLSAGEYLPVAVEGLKANHLLAFARQSGEKVVLIAVPRLYFGLTSGSDQLPFGQAVWRDTRLVLGGLDPKLEWRNIFTGDTVWRTEQGGTLTLTAADLFKDFPVAFLEATNASSR